MRPIRLVAAVMLAASLAGAAAQAQSPAPSPPESRLPEQLDEALRDFFDRMKPALDDLLDTMKVFEDIDGLENYETPEILPNGDIIIRRRPDAPPWQPGGNAPQDSGDGVRT